MSQTQIIANAMRRQWVTPFSALAEFGCLRLGARVHEMKRSGVQVQEKWVELGNGKRVKAFRIG